MRGANSIGKEEHLWFNEYPQSIALSLYWNKKKFTKIYERKYFELKAQAVFPIIKFVLGYSVSGHRVWKNADGKSLKEIEAEQDH